MRAWRVLTSKLRSVTKRTRDDDEFAAEIDSLIEMHAADHRRAGLAPDEADRRARLAIGSIPALVEARRDERGLPRLESIVQDARYAARGFRRQPAFTATALLMLALGSGVTAAIFTFVNAVLLAPLPYGRPDELVAIWTHNPAVQAEASAMSAANVLDLRDGVTSLAGLEAFQANIIPSTLRLQGEVVPTQVVAVTSGLFALLGREPLVGRLVRDGDPPGSVMLSHRFWQRHFGGDPAIIGRPLTEGARPLVVVGVMPPDFGFPYPSMLRASVSFTGSTEVDAWATVPPARDPNRGARLFGVIGRIKPGVSQQQALADIDVGWRRLVQAFPEINRGWDVRVVPLHDQSVGPVRAALWILMAGVGLVMVIAAINVASLFVARSVARQREVALRGALGAGRGRLVQQMLVEGLILSSAGTGLGVAFAWWTTPILVRWAPAATPRLNEVTPTGAVFALAVVMALIIGIVVGLVPVLGLRRASLARALNEGSRTVSDGRHRLRGALVAAEVALAVVLAVGAGLLVRSFIAVLDVDPGFRSHDVLTLAASMPERFDTPAKRVELYHRLFARLEAVPGVVSAGGTTRLPLAGANSSTIIAVDGREPPEGQWPEVDLRRAVHRYFETMGIPLRRGRTFTAGDRDGSAPVVAINETLARLLFGGGDPIGQRVKLGPTSPIRSATVVGVVGDLRHTRLETLPAPEVYVYYQQGPPVAPLIVVRTTGDPAAMALTLRAAVRDVDPQLSPYSVRTMDDFRAAAVADRRFLMGLISGFGLLALMLAAMGVYGVMTLVVAERRREMGVRLALGAVPRRLVGQVVGQAMVLAGAGSAVGLIVALVLTPAIRTQLYAVGPSDPLTIAGGAATLLVVALVASWIPARRVLRVDPMATLRCD
jgi:putative ABC transport system permease protein